MIVTPTVFVLGAGASAPFEFATGIQLSQAVIEGTKPRGTIAKHLHSIMHIPLDDIAKFRTHFQASGLNSVDAFLERRSEYMDIGKLATAFVLIGQENPERLFSFNNNWLRMLYNRMATDYEQFKKNQVAFITFNYDRNPEHFFFEAISAAYDKPPHEVRELMRQHLPIIHLHGRLGYLPWERADKADTLPYHSNIDESTLKTASSNIKIIHEDIGGRDADFNEAKRLLNVAEKIVFLGFGYNERNIARLGIADLPDNKAIGSVLGLGTVARKAALRATNNRITFHSADCTHFMEELIGWP